MHGELGDPPRRPGDTRVIPVTGYDLGRWPAKLGARDQTQVVAVAYEPGSVTLA
jgi:hypothetical protein